MKEPRDLLLEWVEAFNSIDVERLISMYADNATNHQVNQAPIVGKANIRAFFEREFAHANMVCLVENIFQDGNWGILEWKDPLGLRGCGFFQFVEEKIVFQRGYWDRLSFLKIHSLPIDY